MENFCAKCENLLATVTTAKTIHFRCMKCSTQSVPTSSGTLLYEYTKGTNLLVYSTILQMAGQDPVCPKVYRKCVCGNKLVRQVRLGTDMTLINICIKCNTPWLDAVLNDDEKN